MPDGTAVTLVGEGAIRAAAVILALGPEASRPLLAHLEEREIRALAHGARTLRDRSPNEMRNALVSFIENLGGFGTDMLAGDGLLKDMLAQALGLEVAERAFAVDEPPAPPDEILGPLAQASPIDIALLLSKEKPHTIGLVLSAMEPSFATEIFQRLPEELRVGAVKSVARVDAVSPEVLEDVVASLLVELRSMGTKRGRRQLDGKAAAVEMLRRVSQKEQKETIAEIERDDPELADLIRAKIFVFDDIARLTDRDIQSLLKEVDVGQLTIALKGATSGVKRKILDNMSSRVAQMLLDDLQTLGPVRVADVEKVQEEIATLVVQLAADGRVTIVGGNEDML